MKPYVTPSGLDYLSYAHERTGDFTERAWIFSTIDAWLTEPQSPRWFVLTGDPGSGKTTIASRLFQYAQGMATPPTDVPSLKPGFLSAVFFCSARDRRWINPLVFAETIALQLAAQYPSYAQALVAGRQDDRIQVVATQVIEQMHGGEAAAVRIDRLDFGALSADDAFLLAVREPLEALCATNDVPPITILVDALDEALLYGGEVGIVPLIAQAAYLPSAVRFLLTTRQDVDVLEPLRQQSIRELSLSVGSGLTSSLHDIEHYIARKIQDTTSLQRRFESGSPLDSFVMALQQKSNGNFLYVQYVLKMLVDNSQTLSSPVLSEFPDTLDNIYREYLSRLADSPAMWVERYAPVLGVLAVAQEALTRDQMAVFAAMTKGYVTAVLQHFRQFLAVDDTLKASQRTYTLYHRSFADFLLDEDRAERYWCEGEAYHDRIAAYYFATYSGRWEDCDSYGRRYLVVHVNAAPRSYYRMEILAELKQLSDQLLIADPHAADAVTVCALRIAEQFPQEPLAMPLAYWARGNWEAYHDPNSAVQSYHHALQGYRNAGDSLVVGRLYSNLVGSLIYAKRFDEAEAAYDQARDLLNTLGDQAAYYLLALEQNYGLLLNDQGHYDRALASYDRALEVAQRQQELIPAIEIRTNKAVTLMLLGQLEESEALFRQARAEADQQQQILTVALIDRNLGELYLWAGRTPEAIATLQHARAQAEVLDNAELMNEVDALLAETAQRDDETMPQQHN